MSLLTVDNLTVKYGVDTKDELLACHEIDLTIEGGEFVTIIGPSGCGKSTLLHTMGGLISPTDGAVRFDGVPVTKPNPRNAAFVFQDYSLFPWKSVEENAGMGLRFAGASKAEAMSQAKTQLEFVGLKDFGERYPRALSGGMQQRVAIARALALEPKLLLMDEPFGALDEQTRRNLGTDLSRILGEAGQAVVMITHSLDEAIFWADRIVVMSARPGRIAEEITVETPRPRQLEFMTTKRFQDLRVHLFEQLEVHQRDAAERDASSSAAVV
ncbi:ABC transporter ATP-binding protein [Jiangella asiatica]|uniref:ABC transporter ATP-binding protein n=1 Tax=Jiangella asiatica TaxID=2530372 RepID=UPI0013A5D146|nr:ABC transporter ATP-binding protein [Jiangella asiatica]